MWFIGEKNTKFNFTFLHTAKKSRVESDLFLHLTVWALIFHANEKFLLVNIAQKSLSAQHQWEMRWWKARLYDAGFEMTLFTSSCNFNFNAEHVKFWMVSIEYGARSCSSRWKFCFVSFNGTWFNSSSSRTFFRHFHPTIFHSLICFFNLKSMKSFFSGARV